jgi:exodeoxyribonuclease I
MTFLFYDLETYGRNSQIDRIAQFACIRTDEDLNIIAEPLVLYCQLPEDYLPEIEASLVHGISPQFVLENGLSEYDFAKKIYEEFTVPKTCILGYNNIRFDDEFIRNLFYRNFLDTYYREWSNGNSRWDILDLVRIVHDLRPDKIVWAKNEENKPSFRLSDLSKANNLEHSNVHDALSDVYATIDLLKLIKTNQEKTYNFFYTNRSKSDSLNIIQSKNNLFLHTSNMLTSEYGCTSVMTCLSNHPINNNCLLAYDLRYHPQELITLSATEIEKKLFAKDLLPENRIHIKGIHLNKSPIVAPIEVLDNISQKRLNIDLEKCKIHLKLIENNLEKIQTKILEIYSKEYENKIVHDDPELQIYSGGFFSDKDKQVFANIQQATPEELLSIKDKITDQRIKELLRRFIARNFFDIMNDADKESWKKYVSEKLHSPIIEEKLDIVSYKKEIKNLLASNPKNKDKKILQSLYDYSISIESKL